MKKVRVNLNDRSYNILIGSEILKSLPENIIRLGKFTKVLILTDNKVGIIYSKEIKYLMQKIKGAEVFKIKAGEPSKKLSTMENIIGFMLKKGFDRKSLIIALGGGVVGDLAGYTASSFMRGIPFYQVPTTLLSFVDSSVGGKTGVNHALGKNIIGAFHQPLEVLVDVNFLKTLPKKELMGGYAEVIKHGLIRSSSLFSFLEKNHNDIFKLKPALMEELVAKNCKIKADIVSKDEREGGIRALLNFGHTVGHAIESLTGYSKYIHGETVMLGMKAAAICALEMNMWKEAECNRFLAYLDRVGMPKLPKLELNAIYRKMFSDKKTFRKQITMILPNKIGKAIIVKNPPVENIKNGIKSILKA